MHLPTVFSANSLMQRLAVRRTRQPASIPTTTWIAGRGLLGEQVVEKIRHLNKKMRPRISRI
ncbi:MAG: hypothetical protein ABI665_07725 [Vicinamibacterales bacterium]